MMKSELIFYLLCEQAKTTSRKEENVDDNIDNSFIIKTARSSFMSASLDNKQDLDSISPGSEGKETKSVDVVQVEEEIRELSQVFYYL